jgi:hypothetical protein
MSMTDATPETPISPRLEAFQREVDQLKVTGGKANPERTWVIIGGLLMIAGIVVTFLAWQLTHGTKDQLEIADYNAFGTFGIALTIVGAALFIVMSLRRYFRFWLVRLIYEQRDQTDRILSGS